MSGGSSSEATGSDGPSGPPASGRFAPGTTVLYALLWLAMIAQGWSPLLNDDAAARLHYPDSAAERMTSRDLDLAYAIDDAGALEKKILTALYGTREETLLAAIDAQRDALEALTDRDEELGVSAIAPRLAVLLAEVGEIEQASEQLRDARADPVLLDLVAGSSPLPGEALEAHLFEAGLFDWYSDTARLLDEAPDDGQAIREARLARGNALKHRSIAVLVANGLLVLCGALLVVTRVPVLRELLAGDGGAPPWSIEDGLGVFVRGDFWNRFCFLALAWLWEQPVGASLAESPVGMALQSWGSLIASLPLLWLIHHHLLAPARRSASRAFGLDAPVRAVASVALCAIAIDLLGTHALAWSAWGLGFASSWAEGFDEMLVWGTGLQATFTAFDYVVWAPAMEELAFRGLLYYSLRHRLNPAAAALVTAVFFAGLHFYSLPGFLMTLWSGLVWALAFERLRSVLPGVGAHAVYNALYVAGLVLFYR